VLVDRVGDAGGRRRDEEQGFRCASVGANRESEPELRIGFGEGFLSVRLDERLLVRDELIQDVIGEDSRPACTSKLFTPKILFDVRDGYGPESKGAVRAPLVGIKK
jgi:hypothetical protein